MVLCDDLYRNLLIYLIRNQVYMFECQCIVSVRRLWSEELSP